MVLLGMCDVVMDVWCCWGCVVLLGMCGVVRDV